MNDREEHFRIFLAEALEEYENVSAYLVSLENNPNDDKILAEIFRNLHNLKANSNASGYLSVSNLAHKLESIFISLRKHEIDLDQYVINIIYRGIDSLGEILHHINKTKEEKQPENAILQDLDGLLNTNHADESPGVLMQKDLSQQKISLSDMISVEVKQLDKLLNHIGELIINRDRIIALANELEIHELQDLGFRLYKISNEIRQNIMDARLVNLGVLFNKFPRIVRDIAVRENKQVKINITGQDIRIDRSILHIISDTMLHLIRNTISHGIEPRNERKKKDKTLVGLLTIKATSDKGLVNIQLGDDGGGIDLDKIRKRAIRNKLITKEKKDQMKESEILSLIFEPGFSLSDETTEYSGRGMGLYIVKEDIDSLGGVIKVKSKLNKGTTFEITLPTSITVKSSLIFKVNGSIYAIPLFYINYVQTIHKSGILQWGKQFFYSLNDETIPLIYLDNFLNADVYQPDKNKIPFKTLHVILLEYNNRKIGLIPDLLINQQNIVIKPLKKPVANHHLFGGITILGTGNICLLFDVPSMFREISREHQQMVPAK